MPIDKSISFNDLAIKLDEKKITFANEDELYAMLKIKSGAVSFLNIIEVEKPDVILILDEVLSKEEKVGFHPNDNTATIFFKGCEIEKILNNLNIKYKFINL